MLDAVGAAPAEVWTFADLEDAALRIAGGLRELGLSPGDRILIRLENTSAYALLFFGAIAGGITLWLLPDHMVRNEVLRKLNLLVTPLAAGGMMCLMGAWRARRGDDVLRIDRFAYGYVFALSLALVRFIFAQ